MSEKVQNSYDANQIQVLEGLEAVRKRPGMYIGSVGREGLHYLLYETLYFLLEDAKTHHHSRIAVKILPDSTVEAESCENDPSFCKDGCVGATMQGGELGRIGISVVVALSERFEVETFEENSVFAEKYSRGELTEPPHRAENTGTTGKKVRFLADADIFDTLEYDCDAIADRLRELVFLNPGLTIELSCRRLGETLGRTFSYTGGVADYVRFINKKFGPAPEEVIALCGEKDGVKAQIALQYARSFDETTLSFVNGCPTEYGGAHVFGFRKGLVACVTACAQKSGMLAQEGDPLIAEDVFEGLTAVVSVECAKPEFYGATKSRLVNPEVETAVAEIVKEKLTGYFEKHPAVAEAVAGTALGAQKARLARERARNGMK